MKKSGFLLIAVATAMTLTACSRAPESTSNQNDSSTASAPENEGMEPITLHARIDYTSSSTLQGFGKSGTTLSLEILQPAFRSGKGKTASYSTDDSTLTQVQGFVHGSGHAEIKSNDTSIEEHFDKVGSWTALKAAEKGYFVITMPQPSDIGDGLRVEVEVHAPVEGEQWTQAYGQKNPDTTFAHPIECSEHDEHLDDRGPACGVKFQIDPTPTGAKSEAGKILYEKIVDALKQPNGEWVMAMLGQLYGGETTYESDGHFVVHVAKKYTFDKDGSTIDRDLDITVWSSPRNGKLVPKNVKPVKSL